MTLGHGPYGRGDYGAGLYGTDEAADFPAGPLKWNVELLLGAWTDVTPLVYERDGVTVTGGRADEGSTADYSKCTFTLNNRDGAFSPRNPLSPWYGVLGRNTQCRVSVVAGTTRMTGAAGGCNAPDTAGNSVTGDIDIRWDGWFESWRAAAADLAYKYGSAGNRSWYFHLTAAGALSLTWSADGTTAITATSTQPVPYPSTGRKALRVTLDVNNGAAGNTATFYTSDTAAGTWVQLGAAVVTAGTTSLFDSTDSIVIPAGATRAVYSMSALNGIAGTAVANPDFTAQADEATTLTDAAGNVWTFTLGAACSARRYRFWGEITTLPQRWSTGGADAWVPVQASGIMRRLAAGATALRSTLYRGLVDNGLRAYWPCEDEAGASSLASGIGGPPMTFTGTPTLAAFSEFKASAPIPTTNNAKWMGLVPAYTGTGEVEVRFLLGAPGALTNNAPICVIYTTGTVRRWFLTYTTAGGGGLDLQAYDAAGALITSTGATIETIDGKNWYVAVQLDQQGADVFAQYAVYEIGTDGYSGNSMFVVGNTVTACTKIEIDRNSNQDNMAVGQISIGSSLITPVFSTDLFDQSLAYAGRERASGRVQRLCSEEGIGLSLRGYAGASAGASELSPSMGAQLPLPLLDLLRECERTDDGTLFETRGQFGLAYRPRLGNYNRTAALTLAYGSHNVAALEDNPDDFAVINDVVVSRADGSSSHAVQETGPLNVQDPPAGAGRYPATVPINNFYDSELPNQASWRRRQGTVDEARHPGLVVDMANPSLSGNAALTAQVLDLELGDRVDVHSGGAAVLPPDDITLALLGYQETINTFEHTLTLNCAPDAGYQVAVYGDAGSRYSAVGATLGASYSATDVSLSVVTSGRAAWGHGDGDFDILVAGERMTVTAISGTVSPQTFTVTRSVNGVVKAQTSGAAVGLFHPVYYAL